jgi:serine/threonine-protein kinase RsbW
MMKSKKNDNDQRIFRSDYAELYRIREFITRNALSFGFNDKEAGDISLAVDEACTNLIKHAYRDDSEKTIRLLIETNKKKFIVKIMDDGNPFNPLEAPLQNMKEYLSNKQKGGLGIHIIRSVMDEISYYPSTKSQPENVLTLQKTLN